MRNKTAGFFFTQAHKPKFRLFIYESIWIFLSGSLFYMELWLANFLGKWPI